nr:MAG TPA: hypothetical protein [Caudoviricetes sp.]
MQTERNNQRRSDKKRYTLAFVSRKLKNLSC